MEIYTVKKILVSWYGITDLRASLGWEPAGPVVSAMRAGGYDEVHVLQYVESGKCAAGESGCAFPPPADCSPADFVSRVCNTPEANAHFMAWLRESARRLGLQVRIFAYAVPLQHLNDTNGIYRAATAVLDRVAAGPDVQVTLGISPGTTVMALSWAFAALRYPGTPIRLIASPRADLPPEEVTLPEGVRELHESAPRCAFPAEGVKLDVLYHLFGEQRMPSLLGLLQFPARRHVFVTTPEYPADDMGKFLPEGECEELYTDAFDAAVFMRDVESHLASLPHDAKIGFNLTGGTKIMYGRALELCRKHGVLPLYFDIANDRVVNLLDYSSKPTTARATLPQIIHLNSRTPLRDCTRSGIPRLDEQRGRLCSLLMQHRETIREAYGVLSRYSDPPSPFPRLRAGKMEMELAVDGRARIKFPTGQEMKFPRFPAFAKYLAGGWFEEYVYREVKALLGPGTQYDIRLNMELHALEAPPDELYQELDVVITEGRRLYIIECKAGKVSGEQINKLGSVIKSYGGAGGGAILCYVGKTPGYTVRLKAQAVGVKLWPFEYLRKGLRDMLE